MNGDRRQQMFPGLKLPPLSTLQTQSNFFSPAEPQNLFVNDLVMADYAQGVNKKPISNRYMLILAMSLTKTSTTVKAGT